MEDHPWKSAVDEFEVEVLPKLERYGKYIGASANNGNVHAKTVIEKYELLHRSFDPMTAMLLKDALTAWMKENPDLR